MTRLALVVALLAITGCHAARASEAPAPSEAPPSDSPDALADRELALRYALGLSLFDRGEYEQAAAVFAQILLELPQDQSGDQLRHAMIQHIGWALLGSYDVGGDPAALDRGEATLERYLAKHETLFPDANAEREAIYELLAEYQIRRDGEPAPDANERLVALVEDTQASFHTSLEPLPNVIDDGPVRIIEVQTIPWAQLDDPRIQAWLRHPSLIGPSLYDKPGKPINPTRVLVRGLVRRTDPPARARVSAQAYELLNVARPGAERCYESALSRGADLVERLHLELTWDAAGLADVEVTDDHDLDEAATGCVREALRAADRSVASKSGPAQAELSLTFFVQFEHAGPGKNELDTDQFGPSFGPQSRGVPWVEL